MPHKVSFENGTYGMLFNGCIEVLGETMYTEFDVTIVTGPERLWINGSIGQTAQRDDLAELWYRFRCCLIEIDLMEVKTLISCFELFRTHS